MPPKSTPIPKNTATREYFTPNKATDNTSSSGNIDWPSSESSSSSPNPQSSPKTTDADAEESKSAEASPTPSDIVLAAHLDDVVALGEENRKMVERGVEERERKRVLVDMKEILEGRREKERREAGREVRETELENEDDEENDGEHC
jgi:hypothetical protein